MEIWGHTDRAERAQAVIGCWVLSKPKETVQKKEKKRFYTKLERTPTLNFISEFLGVDLEPQVKSQNSRERTQTLSYKTSSDLSLSLSFSLSYLSLGFSTEWVSNFLLFYTNLVTVWYWPTKGGSACTKEREKNKKRERKYCGDQNFWYIEKKN